MAQINLFDLFDEAAECFAESIALDTSGEHEELNSLKQAYFESKPVDYSSPLRKYVYLKSFAPRHALIWRTYIPLKNPLSVTGETPCRLNAIGPGPASEVIGVLESMNWQGKTPKIEVACLENDVGWHAVGEIVAKLYSAKSGRDLHLLYTSSATGLFRSAYVLGSMVVSDLARAGSAQVVLEAIRASTAPASGLFLDTIAYTLPSGESALTSHQLSSIRAGYFVNFKQEGIDNILKTAMENELAAMSRSAISGLSTEFGINAFPVRF